MPDLVAPEFIALQRALAGRYSLERELGRGGMGIVFLARDVALDRPVAIKLLPPAMAAQPALRERFLREAQLAAKLSHPNIIPIFAVDQVGDFVFFVMAYVEGETLGHRLQTKGPLSPSDGVAAAPGGGLGARRTRTSGASCTATSSRTTSCSSRAPVARS